MIRMSFCLVPVLAVLTACSGLERLNQISTPSELYSLTPKSTFSSNLPRLRQQIVVEEPTATAAVDSDQIAVQPTPLRVQYLPGARWVDRAPKIVQSLLIESFENSDRVPAVGSSGIGLRADYYIATDIREFQAQLPEGATPDTPLLVQVRLNIKVIDAESDRIIGSRSFTEFEQAADDEPAAVVSAFDEALGDTMRDAVEWSIRQISAHAREAAAERRAEEERARLDRVAAPAPEIEPEPIPAAEAPPPQPEVPDISAEET